MYWREFRVLAPQHTSSAQTFDPVLSSTCLPKGRVDGGDSQQSQRGGARNYVRPAGKHSHLPTVKRRVRKMSENDAPISPTQGQTLGKYTITKRLGKGGMGCRLPGGRSDARTIGRD